MTGDDVVEVLDRLGAAGVSVWLDGGWGIDALIGRQTRTHDDLDLVIARQDLQQAKEALAPMGLRHAVDVRPGLPARLVLRDSSGRQVDFHPVGFDAAGNGRQELGDGTWGSYPAEELTGTGQIAGKPVRCITAELQLRHHLGYEPGDCDRADMRALARHTGLPLPPPYAVD